MRPILPGAQGPAVEDIQRRLLKLGFDLGSSGVDGLFMGMTRDAVASFQRKLGLHEDGVVGQETWAALVDSTFTLGDRTLYLRLPHFHGHDVLVLQEALSALGFSTGAVDAIFGPSTEHAVRGFQRNCGQPADGIAGIETIGALMNLRHVWEGKAGAPSESRATGPARSIEVLKSNAVVAQAFGSIAREVAERFVNLALASAHDARVSLSSEGDLAVDAYMIVIARGEDLDDLDPGVPVAILGPDEQGAFTTRLSMAIASAKEGEKVAVDLGPIGEDEESLQRAAVRLLDAICVALA